MSLKLRLARAGTKKRPYYHVVVADARSPRDGRFIEKIGTYDPKLADKEKRVNLVTERATHWLSVGAQPTDRVSRFLDAAGVLERAAKSNPKKGEPGEKAKERAEERAAKVAAAEEAAAAPAPVEEAAPAEEAAAEAETVEVVAEAVEEATPAAEEQAEG